MSAEPGRVPSPDGEYGKEWEEWMDAVHGGPPQGRVPSCKCSRDPLPGEPHSPVCVYANRPGRVPSSGFERVHPIPRVEDRDGHAVNVVPDPLWECQDCGAVVKNMPRHIGWHLSAPARKPTPDA